MVDRTPRTLETRAATEHKAPWKRQSVIPAPEPRDGISFRWVRTSSLGNLDNMNVSRRFREGYTPVKAEDFPRTQSSFRRWLPFQREHRSRRSAALQHPNGARIRTG